MPNIKSAKKRVLVNTKKNAENRALRSQMTTAIKKFNTAIEANDIALCDTLLPATFSVIDKTVSKGVIHKNNAANKKSALAKRLSDVKSGKLVIKPKLDNKVIAAQKAKLAQEARDAQKAENKKLKDERELAKIEAAKAKLAAEKPKKASKKDDAEPKAEKPKKASKKEDAEPKAEKVEKAPAKKATKKADAEPKDAE